VAESKEMNRLLQTLIDQQKDSNRRLDGIEDRMGQKA
jgi:hypothetical protein